MALPTMGNPISFDDLNSELGNPAETVLSLNSAGVSLGKDDDPTNWSDSYVGLSMAEFYSDYAGVPPGSGTTTTTTTAAPASFTLYARTLAGSEFTIIYYKVNFNANITAFTGTLDSTCSSRVTISGLTAGNSITLLTDENEFINGNSGTSCPTEVFANSTYTFVLSGGSNNVAVTINTGAATTSTTTVGPTTTTTTTLPPSTAYATTPSHGNSNDACADTTGNPAIFLHLAGSGTIPSNGLFVFTDGTLGDIYIGDGSYIGFNVTQGAPPDYAVAINAFGEITDVVTCTGSETTTTTTTTTVPVSYTLSLGMDGGDSVSACLNFKTTYYGNDTNLNTSTLLYTDAGATTFATPGYYADDFIWKYWDGTAFTSDGFCL